MNNQKPLIGIPSNLLLVEEGLFAGTERLYVGRDYVKCVVDAGGIPILLPLVSELSIIHQMVESIDALLLAGGQDVNPSHYGESSDPLLECVCDERDAFELVAVKHAYALGKPIFGICRGLQLINVAFGGTLYQDLETRFPKPCLKHSEKEKRCEAVHLTALCTQSNLFKMVKQNPLPTNSIHHQAVKDLAPGFRACAWSEDGVIEGIENIAAPFVMGVQWHPELMTDPLMLKLFEGFIQEARNQKGKMA